MKLRTGLGGALAALAATMVALFTAPAAQATGEPAAHAAPAALRPAGTVPPPGTTYVAGTVEARPTLTMRSGPGTGFAPIGSGIPFGATVYVACVNTGTTVTATWPDGSTWTTNVWDGLWDGGAGRFNGAYVSDAWVNTGGPTQTLVPHC